MCLRMGHLHDIHGFQKMNVDDSSHEILGSRVFLLLMLRPSFWLERPLEAKSLHLVGVIFAGTLPGAVPKSTGQK